jgi:hypothetical protein
MPDTRNQIATQCPPAQAKLTGEYFARCTHRKKTCAIHYASQNPMCAGIVARAALFSKGAWNVFPKTPTASNPVTSFRVELHLESEPTRHSRADSRTAKDLSSPQRGPLFVMGSLEERKWKK